MADASDVRYDFIKYVNDHLHEAIRQTDLKAGASMGLAVAMLAVSLALQSFTVFTKGPPDQAEFFMGLASYVLLLIAFGAGIFVIFPRIVHRPPKGWIFWESITGYTMDEFVASLQAAPEEEIRKALGVDSYIKADIVTRKLMWLRVSVYAASLGTILSAATILMKR